MPSFSAYPTLYINNTGYSTDDINYTSFTYPLIINNSSPSSGNLTVIFKSGITLTTVDSYFIAATPNITFDGKGNTININVQSYNGLIQNGTSSNNGQNNIIVQNIGITTSGSGETIGDITNAEGSIAQQYFANNAINNIIQNCFSTIGFNGVNGTNAGLICGSYAGNGGSGSTMLQIKNCYSIRQIMTVNSQGGICGLNANAIISNCYNTSTGNDLGNSGAICSNSTSSNLSISNCYCLSGQLTGPIPITPTNFYNASPGGWTDTAANAALVNGVPTNLYTPGSIWTSIGTNTPYLLSNFNDETTGVQTYNPNDVEIKSTQGTTYNSPSGIFTSPYVYSLLNVNNLLPVNTTINSNTGVISFTSLIYTSAVEYDVYVFTTQGSGGAYFGYNFSNFFLTLLPNNQITINANSTVLINASNQYSVDGGKFTPFNFPCEIVNNNPTVGPITVNFLPEINYTSANNYFVCGSDNIIFDGQNNPITVSIDGWLGLIQNGTTGNNGKNLIVVKNIGIISTNTIVPNAGWVCQQYFGYGISSINNEIQNCYSTGIMTAGESAGICGSYSSYTTITNCYSNGNLPGGYAAGICSNGCSYLNIINCYSLGIFSGTQGSETYCGICGEDCTNEIYINNCYVLNAAQVYGPRSKPKITNCYPANKVWSDSNAIAALTGTPSDTIKPGSVWASVESNTPYLLSQINSVQTYDPNTLSIPADYGSTFTTGPGSFTGGYKYYLLNVNDSSTTSTINQSTGVITFRNIALTGPQNKTFTATMFSSLVVGDPTYYGYNFSTYTITLLYIPPFISDICFPADTPVKTDRGLIPIQKIDPSKHTINYKKIVAITETVSKDDYLVCFKKHSLKYNIPSQDTLISKDHKILYENKLIAADKFLDRLKINKKYSKDDSENEKIMKVPYNGEPLYNVLMEDYDTISVNNMTCETLHPNNLVAKLYNSKLTPEFKQNMIIKMNKSIKDDDHDSYKEGVTKLNTVAFLKRHLK